MAGESPDRSKQQEPSAEPTRGSTSAVPAPADPRLAVAREAAAAAARVDQATAVFSTRALVSADEESGTEARSDADADADAARTPARFAAKAPTEGDARLRAAVAAWVASADEAEAAAEVEAEADAEVEAEVEAETVEEGSGEGGSGEGARGDESGSADDADDSADSADSEDAEGAEDVEGAEGAADSEASEATESKSESESTKSESESESESESAAAEEAKSREESGESNTSGSGDEGASGAEGSSKAEEADEEEPAGEAAPDAAAAGVSASAADSVRESESRADEAADEADGRTADETDGKTQDAASAETDDTAGDDEASGRDVEDPRTPKSSDLSEESSTDDDEPGSAENPSVTEPAEESGEETEGKSVDQPTAVFRTPKRTAVDQPTTMLKFGGAKAEDKLADNPADKAAEKTADKPAGKPADKAPDKAAEGGEEAEEQKAEPEPEPKVESDSEPKVESDSERTSKFVALKPLDEPRTGPQPKPPTPAQGTPRATATQTTAIPQVGPERTAQQPLPPRPPLDLLAELTNTPETRVRTLVRRVKIWTPLVILLVIVFATVQTLRPLPEPELQLTADSSYSFEGGKAEVPWPSAGQAALDVQGIGSFGSSGEQKPVPIASVAKVMTAYIILRDHPLKSGADGPKIEIDQSAEDQSDAGQESTVKVTKGDSISQREALESILIASANNVARLLARWDAGSEKAFVAKMNAAVKDLGMTNTTYTDPSGLNNTTVSTAVDQVKLAKAAMKEPAFREVAAMMSYTDYKGVNHSNWNHLVGSNNVVGIKTGTTTSALGNLVFAAKKEVGGETRTVIGAVVRQPAGGSDNTILGAALDSSDKLIRAAQGALESATILKKGDVVGYVDDGLGGRTPVVATEDVKAVGWAGLKVKLTFAAGDLPRTAKAGIKVGTLTVGDGGTSGAVKVPVALKDDLVEPGWTDKLTRVG